MKRTATSTPARSVEQEETLPAGEAVASPRRVSFHTLGCKLNFAESSTLARQFAGEGFRRVASAAEADICVVNTCSVTAASDKKCRNLIRHIHRENPAALIAVTGCYAQLRPDHLAAIEGVDIVLGNNEKSQLAPRIAALIAEREQRQKSVQGMASGLSLAPCQSPSDFFPAYSSGDRTRAFLKVQDGCDYRCSYCTIPLARGASRNIPIAEVVAQAQKIAVAGQKEIVITGINTGDFGRTTGESFPDLLRALEQVEGIGRYRISSIEPNLLTDGIIAFTAASRRFMPHFHIPLQSGCDRILALMRRRYTTAAFAARVGAVRRALPDAFIGIDVIVAFPGETEEDFEATYAFLEALAPSFLHIFPYSARPDTPAAAMPGQVDPQTAQRRTARLGELNARLSRTFYEHFTGRRMELLAESTHRDGRMGGFTPNYLRVEIPYDRILSGRLVAVELTKLNEKGIFEGTLVI